MTTCEESGFHYCANCDRSFPASDQLQQQLEAAERKLADLAEKILKSNASPWNPDAVVTALLDLKTEAKALAAIEQPQGVEQRQLEERCLDFVTGAKWWEWIKNSATMWQSDQHAAFEAAKLLFSGSTEPWPPEHTPQGTPAEGQIMSLNNLDAIKLRMHLSENEDVANESGAQRFEQQPYLHLIGTGGNVKRAVLVQRGDESLQVTEYTNGKFVSAWTGEIDDAKQFYLQGGLQPTNEPIPSNIRAIIDRRLSEAQSEQPQDDSQDNAG